MYACACFYIINEFQNIGNFLAIQCLGLCVFTAEGMGRFNPQSEIEQAGQHSQKNLFKTKTDYALQCTPLKFSSKFTGETSDGESIAKIYIKYSSKQELLVLKRSLLIVFKNQVWIGTFFSFTCPSTKVLIAKKQQFPCLTFSCSPEKTTFLFFRCIFSFYLCISKLSHIVISWFIGLRHYPKLYYGRERFRCF